MLFYIYAFYAINPFLLVLGIKEEKSINGLEKQTEFNKCRFLYVFLKPCIDQCFFTSSREVFAIRQYTLYWPFQFSRCK